MRAARTILTLCVLWGMALLGLWFFDPQGGSKVHGSILMALAVFLLIQDALFWQAQKKADDAGNSSGVPIAEAGEMLNRVRRLKRYGWNLWRSTLITRGFVLIVGMVHQNALFNGDFTQVFGFQITWKFAEAAVGYLALAAGVSLTMRTYAMFRHCDEALAELEVRARQAAAGKEQAAAILAAAGDWTQDPKLGGYRHVRLSDPKR